MVDDSITPKSQHLISKTQVLLIYPKRHLSKCTRHLKSLSPHLARPVKNIIIALLVDATLDLTHIRPNPTPYTHPFHHLSKQTFYLV